MIREVWPLMDAAGMRALDLHTIETLGVPGEVLMESAGRAVVDVVLRCRAQRSAGRREVLVACGGGNNGGDGLVVARHLHALGVPVAVVLVADPEAMSGDAAANLARARAAGVSVSGGPLELAEGAVVVDALFGTGLVRAVKGRPAEVIGRINARPAGCTAVAVDLPSGLDADTGRVLGPCTRADVTVTFGLPKLGLVLEPGRSLAGRVWAARIGIADVAPGVEPVAQLWTRAAAGGRLPARPADGHKGSFGHVLVVAGSEGKTGAAALAARGAGRVGGGLVTVACPAGLNDILEAKCTEAMTAPVADTGERSFAASAEDAILALAEERDVVALGPGIGRAPDTVSLVRSLCKRLERPLVLDADGVNAFAGSPGELRARAGPTLITPHPGEAARLLGGDRATLGPDRVAVARRLAEETGAVVLFKGAPTVVAAGSDPPVVNPTGGPALASGGTGDVLTGVLAGLLAQGMAPPEAAALAAYLHGLAGDRVAKRTGPAGLLAEELADAIPETMEVLRRCAREGPREVDGAALALSFPEP